MKNLWKKITTIFNETIFHVNNRGYTLLSLGVGGLLLYQLYIRLLSIGLRKDSITELFDSYSTPQIQEILITPSLATFVFLCLFLIICAVGVISKDRMAGIASLVAVMSLFILSILSFNVMITLKITAIKTIVMWISLSYICYITFIIFRKVYHWMAANTVKKEERL